MKASYNSSKVFTEVNHLYSEALHVGGNDINDCIIRKYVTPELKINDSDVKLKKRIFEGVERAKRSLSGNTEVRLAVEAGKENGDDWSKKLTRDELDSCVSEKY